MQTLKEETEFKFDCPLCKATESIIVTFGELMNEHKNTIPAKCSNCNKVADVDSKRFRDGFMKSLEGSGIRMTKK